MAFYPYAGAATGTRPALDYPTGLRRWRAARGLADAAGAAIVPVICLGDSITWGVGSDNTLTTVNATAILNSWPGRLQALFGFSPYASDDNPGEGYIFANDSRVTVGGAPVTNLWASTLFGQGYRLIGAGQTLSITIPAGVTSIGVIQGNQTQAFNSAGSNLADVSANFNINGGASNPVAALTNTGVPVTTYIAVTAGQVFQLTGPVTAQSYISGFVLNSSAVNGVQVHRCGLNGAVSGSLLGGQSAGNLAASAGNQIVAARSCYQWAPVPGLIIVMFSVNDQQFQNGGGTASQNGVTLAKYQAWNQQFALQATADGWSVLFIGGPQNQGYNPGSPQLDSYNAALQGIAASNDNIAFISVSDLWGAYAQSQALGVQISGSEHPTKSGALDVAAMVYPALLGYTANGITSLVPG
jgi:lysophospholipase L1-like esterase